MEDIKFNWVLRANKGGLFSLHQICDREIVWKRGYVIANIDEHKLQNQNPSLVAKIVIYRMGKGGISTTKVNHIRRQSQIRNCITSSVPCTFIVAKDGSDNIIDINYAAVAIVGIRSRIEPKTLNILEGRASKYDELAPPEDVNKKAKIINAEPNNIGVGGADKGIVNSEGGGIVNAGGGGVEKGNVNADCATADSEDNNSEGDNSEGDNSEGDNSDGDHDDECE